MRFTHTQAVVVMAASTLMWSIAGVVTRHLESARSFEITFWRSFFTVCALVVLTAWPAVRRRQPVMRESGGPALWISGACWSVMFTAFMVALTMTSVANVLVVMSIGPLFTAVLARFTMGQRLPARTWATVAVAGAGIVWMYAPQVAAGAWGGTLVALCVPVAAGINWTVVQRCQRHGQAVDLVPAVLIGAVLSALATLPLAWPFGATGRDLLLLALLGVVQLAIPCVLVVHCARVLKAPEVALLALLEVVFGIALAWVGAGEDPGPRVLAGGIVVLAALALNEILGLRDRRAVDTAPLPPQSPDADDIHPRKRSIP
ncbi:permease [Xylophilus sp. Leaf220]|nr:permease [Xylophilus sp. Leaf220]